MVGGLPAPTAAAGRQSEYSRGRIGSPCTTSPTTSSVSAASGAKRYCPRLGMDNYRPRSSRASGAASATCAVREA